MKLYKIRHLTRYHYQYSVVNSYNLLCLKPISDEGQSCREFSLKLHPECAHLEPQTDWFGNHKLLAHLPQSHQEFFVEAFSEVSVWPQKSNVHSPLKWQEAAPLHHAPLSSDLQALLCSKPSPLVPTHLKSKAYQELVQSISEPSLTVTELAQTLSEQIYYTFCYDPEFSSITTPLLDVVEHQRGVCQDFAHLGISVLRSLGLASRYVSGYLETKPPPGQPRLVGADASHAWFEVFCPQTGWHGFDPTNNLRPSGQHIVLARGRDYSDVMPLKGLVLGHGKHKMDVQVDVTPQS